MLDHKLLITGINLKPVMFVCGLIVSKLALFMYIPAILALVTHTKGATEFGEAILIAHLFAFILIHYGRTEKFRLSVREMFLLTASVWIISCAFAAIPLVLIEHISYTDAYFEAMSGLTTTGSTILSGLDDMPKSLLLWRSILQWLGGIGFIVLGVAVLPFLNVGGMRLFHTESSDWSDKSAPKTQFVATHILIVYILLSLLCTIGYKEAGMGWFEAINHAMTTISTGGYSTSDESMAHFSAAAQWIGALFMFLGGLPFLLYVQSMRHKRISLMYKDEQVRGFILLLLIVTPMMSYFLWQHSNYSFLTAFRISLFNIISIVTTTGYGLTDFSHWGAFTTVLFAFLMLIGACSGSTSGGFKLFRIQISIRLFTRQLKQLLHPRAIFTQIYNEREINNDIVLSMVAFSLAYMGTIFIISVLLGVLGLDPTTAITGAVTAVANVGPGLGNVIGPNSNFSSLPDIAKWVLSAGMLMGRLEILTVLILFFPLYWRRN